MSSFCLNLAKVQSREGVNLISDVLPFGRLWYGDANAVANATGFATFVKHNR